MNENVPSPNRSQVIEDKRKLKNKGIKSPDIKRMTYFIHDKKLRATYFYREPGKYIKKYRELLKESVPENFIISHPDLCKKSISRLEKEKA